VLKRGRTRLTLDLPGFRSSEFPTRNEADVDRQRGRKATLWEWRTIPFERRVLDYSCPMHECGSRWTVPFAESGGKAESPPTRPSQLDLHADEPLRASF
jgi:hypothetical protein